LASHLSFVDANVAVDFVRDDFKYPDNFWSFDGDVPGRAAVTGLCHGVEVYGPQSIKTYGK
jgi:hypothetical protein